MEANQNKRNEEIRSLYKSGLRLTDLAKKYGITRQRIEQIIKRRKNIDNYSIYRKFDYICQWCGKKTTTLNSNCHHINLDPSDNREKNLILLCTECHNKFHTLERWSRILGK